MVSISISNFYFCNMLDCKYPILSTARRFDDSSNLTRKLSALTRCVLSVSPQGNLLMKSIPVSGVTVGGRRRDASIVTYSIFRGLA